MSLSQLARSIAESPHLDSGEQRLTEIIRNHSQRVNTIIENVLQLSRRGQTNPKELDLIPWLLTWIS